MSDKILNKLQGEIKTEEDVSELMSELDKRITDILHTIEFFNPTPQEARKIYCRLQSFLKKKRALKNSGRIYTPRTESGNFIKDGKVIKPLSRKEKRKRKLARRHRIKYIGRQNDKNKQ